MLFLLIMKVELLYQGFNPNLDKSIGAKIFSVLESEPIDRLTILTAFSADSIIKKLFAFLEVRKINIPLIRIITGIDQKGTSKEALESLKQLENIEARVFFSSTHNIFHPKIYLFETPNKTFLIIGSSNFTQQGLFLNIETAFFLEIENNIPEDIDIVQQLKDYFSIIESDEDPNLYVLNSELISDLESKNLLPSQAEILSEVKKTAKSKEAVKSSYPTRQIPKLPDFFKDLIKSKKDVLSLEPNEVYQVSSLLWKSGPLTERDLNVPSGSNTNITGDINIDKGAMPKEIDFRHYYREIVFSNLAWANSTRRRSEHLEEATADFEIVIDGVSQGVFNLKLSHNPRTDVKSYEQKNAMTKLKWGDARVIVAKPEYLGKTLQIKSTGIDGKYLIDIR